MKLTTGTLLGPYEISHLLGAGGMGEVYLARDTRLGRAVAIKVLPGHLAESEESSRRFEREARTISQLQHPNICALYDVGSEQGIDFLVMEYLEGETLEQHLTRGPMAASLALDITAQIAEGIAAAHTSGLVHRDLKPGNVMLTEAGVKILDFGLARKAIARGRGADETTATAITGAGRIAGTLPYMAPEQLQGKIVDERCDIWALGCLLYQMTTGERPFRGDTQADLIGSILQSEPAPPSTRCTLLPERIDWLVSRCLEKDPIRRWQSARELAVELRTVAAGQQNSSRVRSRRALAAFAGIAVFAFVTLWWVQRDSRLQGEGETQGDQEPQLTSIDEPSVGVLPFDNVNDDPEVQALVLGLWNELLEGVGHLGKPVDRVALRDYEGGSPCQAADLSGSRWIYTGSITRAQSQLRVNARLWDCPEEISLWQDSFDLEMADQLSMQDELAERIRATSQESIDASRYSGRPGSVGWYLGRREPAANALALELTKSHLARDPSSVTAYGFVMLAHLQALIMGWEEDPEMAIDEMIEAEQSCFKARPNSSLCYWLSGHARQLAGDGKRMDAAFSRLVALQGEPDDYGFLARAQAFTGQPEEAIENIERAIERSPEDAAMQDWLRDLALAHFARSDFEESRETAQRCVDLGTNSPWNALGLCYQLLAASSAHLGQSDRAQQALREALVLNPQLTGEVALRPFAAATEDVRRRYLKGLEQAGLDS